MALGCHLKLNDCCINDFNQRESFNTGTIDYAVTLITLMHYNFILIRNLNSFVIYHHRFIYNSGKKKGFVTARDAVTIDL
jgi:hypothetical protein